MKVWFRKFIGARRYTTETIFRFNSVGLRISRFFSRHKDFIFRWLFRLIFSLLLAEGIIRVFSLDWRLFPNLLYYEKADLFSHQPDPDSRLLYRLKPGFHDYGNGVLVTINSLGARGPERSVAKPLGVFRIICVGGSNVYGSNIPDEAAWPARLEAELNRTEPGRYEVWNFGTSAYVPLQMAVIGREAVEKYKPDLLIFAVGNNGAPAFLWNSSPKEYFRNDTSLWDAFFMPDCLTFPSFIPYNMKRTVVRHSYLYRYISGVLIGKKDCSWERYNGHEAHSINETRSFFAWAKDKTRLLFLTVPGNMVDFSPYFKETGVPVFEMRADELPEEYREAHPPAYVFEWYGKTIAEYLKNQGFLFMGPGGAHY